jgi:heptaprenylglyceryl phosphate synthase
VTYVCLRADIIVTGTIAENTLKGTGDPEALARIIRAVKGKR